jgi:hypothetical protein
MQPRSKTLLLGLAWLAISLLIYLFSNPIGRLIELAQAQRLSSEHGLGTGESSNLGALVEAPQHLLIKFTIHFRVDPVYDPLSFPNLFQTDDVNSGIRVELSGRTLGVIFAQDQGRSQPKGVIVTRELKPEKDYLLELLAETESGWSIRLDGKTIEMADPHISFSLHNFRIGVGLDDTRKFVGPIGKWELLYYNHAVGVAGYVKHFSLISSLPPVMLLLVLAGKLWRSRSRRPERQAATALQELYLQAGSILFANRHRRPIAILAAAAPILAVIYVVASSELAKSAIALRSQLLPGMLIAPDAGLFKGEVAALAIVQLSFVLVISVGFLFAHKAMQPRTDIGRYTISLILFLNLTVILICWLMGTTSRIAFGFTGLSLLLAASLLVPRHSFPTTGSTSSKENINPEGGPGPHIARSLKWIEHVLTLGERYRRQLLAGLFFVCMVLTAPLFSAWYPLTLPNDYMEISDNFSSAYSASGDPISRSQVLACLKQSANSVAPACQKLANFNRELNQSLAATTVWQGEPGRALYHHSYVYVPAAHLLKYGYDRALPYLYGFGNTSAHAVMMALAGGPTLSSYFNTVPLAELLGLLSIASLVLYATRNAFLFLLSYLIALACLYSVQFTAVFLAISFSPLRYFGLVVQIASIIFVARNNTRASVLVLICAACLSYFWNKEFAVLGLAGQGLWLLSAHQIGILERGIALVGMFALLVAASILTNSPDSISAVTTGLFNVWTPAMLPSEKVVFILLLVGGQIGLMALAGVASDPLRAALLSITPVVGCLFVKYAFNPSPPHLNFVFIFAASIAVIFVPWTRITPFPRAFLLTTAFVSVIAYTASASRAYLEESDGHRQTLTRPFASDSWSQLGETISFATPEADIFRRVSAIKALTTKFDRVLLLSPFDHLLSFYVNPPMFCGHFEVMTNLATTGIQEQLENCGARPGTLVVYDKALATPCPTDPIEPDSRCAERAAMKSNLDHIIRSLSPRVQRIAETGDLIFYTAR